MDVSRTHKLLEILQYNRVVLVVMTLVSVISLLVFVTSSNYPYLDNILRSSANTPWGIVTSIFLHADFSHFFSNMVGLWLWTFFVMLPDGLLNREQTKQRLSQFFPIVLCSAILANILWLFIVPEGSSRGASGLVFAVSGVALGFSLINILKIGSGFKMLSQQFTRKRLITALFGNILAVVMFLVLIIFFTNYFLVVEPGVNSFAHGVAFLLAFFYVMVREYYGPYVQAMVIRWKNSRKPNHSHV